jgi:hypothetical protein
VLTHGAGLGATRPAKHSLGAAMPINREWHLEHRLPRTASREERLEWHLGHAVNCGCREMPPTIRQELERRGLLAPTPRSLR